MTDDAELIAVSDRVILVDRTEQWIGSGVKIGAPGEQAVFAMTFAGKLNNRDERDDVTVFLGVREAFNLAGDILEAVEWATQNRATQ